MIIGIYQLNSTPKKSCLIDTKVASALQYVHPPSLSDEHTFSIRTCSAIRQSHATQDVLYHHNVQCRCRAPRAVLSCCRHCANAPGLAFENSFGLIILCRHSCNQCSKLAPLRHRSRAISINIVSSDLRWFYTYIYSWSRKRIDIK